MSSLPTAEQWSKLIRIVKRQQQSIDDLWEAVNSNLAAEAAIVDETVEDLKKDRRRITRLEKRVEELEK